MTWRTWRAATEQALYGAGGFYRRPEGPAGHFRTSVHASPLFARAVIALAEAAGADVVTDIGAGRGELLRAIHTHSPGRFALRAVELGPSPADLPAAITWSPSIPTRLTGLVIANEWLDNVPIDVVRNGRIVEVDNAGAEREGAQAPAEDLAWVARWWPDGERAEVGRPRDDAWAQVIERLEGGIAVAIDYAVGPPYPPEGTLTGYRAGRQVRPVPDGSCDITSHVVLASVAAAGHAAGATHDVVLSQRQALRALGVRGETPPITLARTDPARYADGLVAASEAAELTDPRGLGAFAWLVQGVGVAVPAVLTGASPAS